MGRTLAFVYGVTSYLIFLVACVYSIGFILNAGVPKSIDSGAETGFGQALLIDAALLGLFAIPHSVMARQGFKKWWTRFIVQPVERSTYVLFSSLLLLLLFWQWRPMPGVVWDVENPTLRLALYALYWLGWFVVIIGTFLVDHFDFFGLRQVYLYLKGKEYTEIGFKQPSLYKVVRHPIMLGFIIAFWAAPRMTVGHVVFAAASTAYILVGLHFEERDLVSYYGEAYNKYRREVSMLIPLPRKR